MSIWAAVLLSGLVSYLLRVVPVAWLADRVTPAWLERSGHLVAPVAFAALGGTAMAGAATAGATEVLPLAAGVLVTAVLTRLTAAPSRSVLAGMVALWLVAALV